MTRIAACADVHLGNMKRFAGEREASLNQRCREGLDVFARAVLRAVELECDAFVVLGDLLDYQRPEAQLLAAIQRALAPARERHRPMKVLLMVGNHDQTSDAPGDHALGPLAPFATIVDKPKVFYISDEDGKNNVQLGLIPFRPGAPADDWLPDAVRSLMPAHPHSRPERRVLGVHLGIRDDSTAPWLRSASDAIGAETLWALADEVRVRHVLAGNWHDRRRWSFGATGSDDPLVELLQLGALVPTGFDNEGLDGYGTLAVWEDGAVRFEELAGPRFVQTDAAGIGVAVSEAGADGHRLYVQVKAPPDGLAAAVLALHQAAGDITDDSGLAVDVPQLVGEVVPDGTAAVEQAREAASAASSATSLEGALAAFLEEMPLEAGVDRAEVSATVRGFLGMPGGA